MGFTEGLRSKGNRRVIMNLAGNCTDLAVIRQEKLVTDELAREVCDQARTTVTTQAFSA